MPTAKRTTSVLRLATIAFAALYGTLAHAADIHLRESAHATASVVCLRDVADILGDDATAKTLGGIELCAAPPDGTTKTLRAREIQDLLALRGVDVTSHRFTGASAVTISRGGAATNPNRLGARPAAGPRGLRESLQAAIGRHLRETVAHDEKWTVQVRLSSEQTRELSACDGDFTVSGGHEPWIGTQRFDVRFVRGSRSVNVPIDAVVSTPASIVVAARPLAKGDVVRASDLTVERTKYAVHQASHLQRHFRSIDEVVGMETLRPIAPGQAVETAAVRKPLLVQRGDVVTVSAYSSGVRVKTTARARQAGSQGELIEVESLADRSRYFARVCDVQQVEVFARAPAVE